MYPQTGADRSSGQSFQHCRDEVDPRQTCTDMRVRLTWQVWKACLLSSLWISMQRTWQNQMCCMRILNAQRVISCMYSLSVEWSGEKTFQELLVAANCSLTPSDSLCCHSCAKSCLSLQHSHKSDMHSRKKKPFKQFCYISAQKDSNEIGSKGTQVGPQKTLFQYRSYSILPTLERQGWDGSLSLIIHLEVSWNGGTPKSSIYRWIFPLQTNHFEDPPLMETPI